MDPVAPAELQDDARRDAHNARKRALLDPVAPAELQDDARGGGKHANSAADLRIPAADAKISAAQKIIIDNSVA
ncbi:MAG: hypothetical protein MJY99_05975 [Fibrobacter sp.]|nr:hypothetical protein [Fibrobacter sp.]